MIFFEKIFGKFSLIFLFFSELDKIISREREEIDRLSKEAPPPAYRPPELPQQQQIIEQKQQQQTNLEPQQQQKVLDFSVPPRNIIGGTTATNIAGGLVTGGDGSELIKTELVYLYFF